jgi:uncharacterized repeat protein (TIGR02543 family)
MKFKHRSTWFLSSLLAAIIILGPPPIWAQPTIPQDLLDQIAEQGSARVIVGLDIEWQPEGLLNSMALREQRRLITNTQTQFVETLNQDLTDDDLIDSPHAPDGTPTVQAARTFETVPYLVFEVNSLSLPYVQNTPKAKTLQLSVPDQPTMSESLPLIGADKAWDNGHTGAGQAIAIIDTGVDNTHTAFAPDRIIAQACFSVTHCPNGQAEQTDGVDAAQPCEFDSEGCGHGTHVAGIAAGTAPEAKIIAVQAASNFFGKASFYKDDQLAALDWLHANRETFGVPLAAVNMSIGGQKAYSQACDDDPRAKIIQNLESVGIATLISAGNHGYADGISAPACISKAISVGAVDKTGQLWPESNRAGILDLLAPGVGIESALPGGLTAVKDGTSMAAPHVAGAWAILKAHNPKAPVAEVLSMLKETGETVEGIARIQVDAALPQLHAAQDLGLNDGLVGYYPFNGNANDESGNRHHANVYGARLTTDRFGIPSKAYYFDGINDYIQVPNHQSLEFAYSNFTFYAVIKVPVNTQKKAYNKIISKPTWKPNKYGKGTSMYLRYGKFCFHSVRIGNGSNGGVGLCSKKKLTDDKWHHVVAIREGNFMKVYVDGNFEGAASGASKFKIWSTQPLTIGHQIAASGKLPYKGAIDDVRIYKRALSDSEIRKLYRLRFVTLSLSQTGEGKITSTNNSIGCTGSCKTDYEINSRVTLKAIPSTGYSFTGWSGDCFGTSAIISVNLNAAKSCTASFKKDILHPLNVSKTGEGKITSTDNTLNCGETCQATYEADNTVTLTATPATGYNFAGWTGDCSGTSATTTVTMNAAKSCAATFEKEPVSAKGCDVITEGLVACYPFDGNANDRSGNGNDGTSESGVSFVDGKMGTAAKFDGGNNAYIRIPHNATQKFDDQFSIAGWVLSNGNGGVIFNKYTWAAAGGGGKGFAVMGSDDLSNAASGSAIAAFARFNTSYSGEEQNWPVSQISVGQLHYFTVTYNDSQIKLYVNAELKSEKTIPFVKTLDNSYDMLIGAFFTNDAKTVYPGAFFDGLLDDLRIYNRALSESEIKQLYELDSDNDNASVQKTITVNKTGKGRGTVKIDISAEDRTHYCKTDCSEMTQPLFTANEIVLTAIPTKGFIFKQWAGECSGTESRMTVPMTASKTCTADFDLDPNLEIHLLTLNRIGNQGRVIAKGGIDCGENCTAYYPSGQKVRLEAQFNEADTLFLGWEGECSGFQNVVYLTMDEAKSCTATFKAYDPDEQFALSINNEGDGVGTIRGRAKEGTPPLICQGKTGCKQDQQMYASGSQITLSAIPDTGFEFIGGSGDCAWESDTDNTGKVRGSATVIMDQAKSCTAEFGLKADLTWHTLTIQLAGTGNGSVNTPGRMDCGNQCTADYYEAGKAFYIKAAPTALSQFIGWGGDCEGKGTGLKLSLEQDMTCIAQFKSDFEILAEEMLEAFYATATSNEGTPIGEIYPQNENGARLKEAFWVAITAILQTDYSLILSQAQNWPTQFDGINWLPSDSSTQYTKSVQMVPEQFLGIEVELLAQNGETEKLGIVIYYTEQAPLLDEGIWSRRVVRIAMFSRYAFRRW